MASANHHSQRTEMGHGSPRGTFSGEQLKLDIQTCIFVAYLRVVHHRGQGRLLPISERPMSYRRRSASAGHFAHGCPSTNSTLAHSAPTQVQPCYSGGTRFLATGMDECHCNLSDLRLNYSKSPWSKENWIHRSLQLRRRLDQNFVTHHWYTPIRW